MFGRIKNDLIERSFRALDDVGLNGFENRPVGALSRGQFQRVLFARLMVQEASVILLDEPFTAIDDKTCKDLLAIVHRWHVDGRTVIAVLHDYGQIREHFPDTLLLAREGLAAQPPRPEGRRPGRGDHPQRVGHDGKAQRLRGLPGV